MHYMSLQEDISKEAKGEVRDNRFSIWELYHRSLRVN